MDFVKLLFYAIFSGFTQIPIVFHHKKTLRAAPKYNLSQ